MNVSSVVPHSNDLEQVSENQYVLNRINLDWKAVTGTGGMMGRFWTIRAGRTGERAEWAFAHGVIGGGFNEVGDLAQFQNKDEVRSYLSIIYPEGSINRIANYTGQLWTMSKRIGPGDFMVLPVRSAAQIAIGRVTGPYRFDDGEPDIGKRHQIPVDWLRVDIPKSQIKQDLLYQLGSALTVFEIKNGDAPYRLQQVLDGKPDPGARRAFETKSSSEPISPEGQETGQEDSAAYDIEELAQDDITRILQQEFKGHELARLVEELLAAEGFVCKRGPEGSDGGVDVLAGMGPLGMDSPKLVVQVKSQTEPVPDGVLQQLNGAIHRFQADQALLVTYGGVTGPAKKFLASQPFTVRVWATQEIIDSVARHYDVLSADTKARLPLKRIWVPVVEKSDD